MAAHQANWASAHELSNLIKQCLEEGLSVEIEGLGAFVPGRDGGYEFKAFNRAQIFIAYAVDDAAAVDSLCDALEAGGLDPWIDRRRLMPGQNWPRAIQNAIEVSDYFLACFSQHSVSKRGNFQAELRYALDCAAAIPPDDIYFIPVRLDACPVPAMIAKSTQYVDLFPDWDKGIRRIVSMAHREQRRRARHPRAA